MKRLLLLAIVIAAGCGRDTAMPVAHVLSPEQANHIGLGYSPDGSRMAWWEKEGAAWRLWIARADMSDPRKVQLTSQSADMGAVLWAPDGSRFVAGASMTTSLPVLYVVDTGLAVRRVTTDSLFAVPLSWNPDGKRVTYLSVENGAVITMARNVDSGAAYTFIPDEKRPHIAFWSPDGRYTGVMILGIGHPTISIGDSAGAHRRLISSEGFEFFSGQGFGIWAPNSSGLVYTSNRTGTTDLWFAPVDGAPPRQLTTDVRDDDQPIWSPDSKWIAFRSTRGLQTDLWVMPAAGGEARRVTDDGLAETLVGWRAGTSELLYSTGRTSRTLWRYALADSSERQLTPDSLELAWYEPAADGRAAVLINRGGGVNDLAIVPAGGGALITLLHDARADWVQWSPDGSRVAFQSDRGGSMDIWVMDAGGGAPRQLTRFPTRETNPVWSADGSTIRFLADHEATWNDLWSVPASGGEPRRITNGTHILGMCPQTRRKDDVIVFTLNRGAAAFSLTHVDARGRLTTLWDRTTPNCGMVSPAGDTLLASVTGEGGKFVTMLLPLNGRPGRQVLRPGETGNDWSPDGRHVLYQFTAEAEQDFGILDVAGGVTQRLTNTGANETGGEFSADGSAVFFQREVPISRLASVDVSRVLARRE